MTQIRNRMPWYQTNEKNSNIKERIIVMTIEMKERWRLQEWQLMNDIQMMYLLLNQTTKYGVPFIQSMNVLNHTLLDEEKIMEWKSKQKK